MSERYDAAKARMLEAWNAKDARIAQLEAQINDYLSHSAREREKVEADIAVLVEALAPFAELAPLLDRKHDPIAQFNGRDGPKVVSSDFHAAREALTRIQGEYRCGEVAGE